MSDLFRTKFDAGMVGVGVRVQVRVYRVLFWAAFDIFRLIILEAHVGQTKFPDLMLYPIIIIRNCGKGGSLLSWQQLRMLQPPLPDMATALALVAVACPAMKAEVKDGLPVAAKLLCRTCSHGRQQYRRRPLLL